MSRSNSNSETIICINCPKGCRMLVDHAKSDTINVTGYDCPRGREYAIEEYKDPVRILTTTVRVKNGALPLVPVKTIRAVPKIILFTAMKVIAKTEVEAPVEVGQVIIENLLDSGVDLVATRNITAAEKNL